VFSHLHAYDQLNKKDLEKRKKNRNQQILYKKKESVKMGTYINRGGGIRSSPKPARINNATSM
jgi:hypothetical protein